MKLFEIASDMKQQFDTAKLKLRIEELEEAAANSAIEIQQLKKRQAAMAETLKKLIVKLGPK